MPFVYPEIAVRSITATHLTDECHPQCRPLAATISPGRQPAPKTQWVMVEAPKDRFSGWLGGLRLLRRRLKSPGAIRKASPFPVADSPETSPWSGKA
jgi:hypothetical protein